MFYTERLIFITDVKNAAALADRLSDHVRYWITQNEPLFYIGAGLESGQHAPGWKLGKTDLFCPAHYPLCSHGSVVQAIRTRAKKKPEIGYAPALWWFDPVLLGRYPEEAYKIYAGHMPQIGSGDMTIIAQPTGFIDIGNPWISGGCRILWDIFSQNIVDFSQKCIFSYICLDKRIKDVYNSIHNNSRNSM